MKGESRRKGENSRGAIDFEQLAGTVSMNKELGSTSDWISKDIT